MWKPPKNSHKDGIQKWTNFDKLERGETMKQKWRPLSETSREKTKSHLDIP
jgi:hypothetical protein